MLTPTGEIRRWVYDDESIVRGFYFLPGYREPRRAKPGDEFYTQGSTRIPRGRTDRRIRVAEVDQMYVARWCGRAWFAGLTNGRAVSVESAIAIALLYLCLGRMRSPIWVWGRPISSGRLFQG